MKLPYLTKNLPRFIGEIKVLPEHFEVEEVPLYPACGEGQHIYVNVTRKNYNTKEIAFSLKKLFCVSECDVGCAGLKDKNAQATQTFSLSLGVTYEQDRAVELINKNLPDLTINWVLRHKNKLKTGHLLGNKFKILVTTDDPQALKKSNDIYQQLGGIGFANYFGPQRFGSKGDNAINGKEILLGNKKKSKKTASFLLLSSAHHH